MEKTRVVAEEECESGRETLRDKFEETYVSPYISVYRGHNNDLNEI